MIRRQVATMGAMPEVGSMPAVIISGAGMGGMGNELTEAWEKLKTGAVGKVTGQLDRVEIALKLAVAASVTAAVFSILSWHSNRRR